MKAISYPQNSWMIIGLIFGLYIAISFSTYAGESEIDFNKTISYIKRLENRDDFPVSVTFAYYYLKSLHLLGVSIPSKPRIKTIKFLLPEAADF